MLKKVLSVVLALVLTVGVCGVASSAAAATVADLENYLELLPTEYNAYFYNDETKAMILNARSVATAAIASGAQADIDNAYAVCQATYDKAYEVAEYEFPADTPYAGEVWTYFANRDESKAVIDIGLTPSFEEGAYLQPGDTFTLTFSLKNNFYLATSDLGFAYDHSMFKVVDTTISPEIDEYYVLNGPNPDLGHHPKSGSTVGRYPSSWTAEEVAKYNIYFSPFGVRVADEQIHPNMLMFTEKTNIMTVTMQVLETAEYGQSSIFIDEDFAEHYIITDFDYEYPAIRFTRGRCEMSDERLVAVRLNGTVQTGQLAVGTSPIDQQACYDHTISYPAPVVVNVGEAPALADYTALDEAIASINNYEGTRYTEESWSAFASAVQAGAACDRKLGESSQSVVDALTQAIIAARGDLMLLDQGSLIKSVTAVSEVRYNDYATLEVKIDNANDAPIKLRHTNSAGASYTLAKDHPNVLSVVDNNDGTETWTIKVFVYSDSDTYTFTARYANAGWVLPGYVYKLKTTVSDQLDLNVYSYAIEGAEDGRLLLGTHEVTMTTGKDVIKVQLVKDGTTWTYSAANASYVDVDGQRVWTFNHRFHKLGNNQSYDIRVRSGKTTFETKNESITVDVLA